MFLSFFFFFNNKKINFNSFDELITVDTKANAW